MPDHLFTPNSVFSWIALASARDIELLNKRLKTIKLKLAPRKPRRRLPRWDSERQILYFGKVRCCYYDQDAPNQFEILNAFQLRKWPDMLVGEECPDEPQGQSLKDAIRKLNRNQSAIMFRQRGGRYSHFDRIISWEKRT